MKNTNVVAKFVMNGKPVVLETGKKYDFIEKNMEFFLDEDGLINSICGCQWTKQDFCAEVNAHKSFPVEVA